MSATTSLEEMSTRIRDVVDEALRPPMLVEARAWANEVGIAGVRRNIGRALDIRRDAQTALRAAETSQRAAKDEYDSTLANAEWELGGTFVSESNKWFLLARDPDGNETSRRQVTAEVMASWIKREAKKRPDVVQAAGALHRANDAAASAQDAADDADRWVYAAQLDLTAAVAELNLLAAAIPHKEISQ